MKTIKAGLTKRKTHTHKTISEMKKKKKTYGYANQHNGYCLSELQETLKDREAKRQKASDMTERLNNKNGCCRRKAQRAQRKAKLKSSRKLYMYRQTNRLSETKEMIMGATSGGRIQV